MEAGPIAAGRDEARYYCVADTVFAGPDHHVASAPLRAVWPLLASRQARREVKKYGRLARAFGTCQQMQLAAGQPPGPEPIDLFHGQFRCALEDDRSIARRGQSPGDLGLRIIRHKRSRRRRVAAPIRPACAGAPPPAAPATGRASTTLARKTPSPWPSLGPGAKGAAGPGF